MFFPKQPPRVPNSVPVGTWLRQLSPEQQQDEQREQVNGGGEVPCGRGFYLLVFRRVGVERGSVVVQDDNVGASLTHVVGAHAASRAADIITCRRTFENMTLTYWASQKYYE